ncbi:MAG: hypothetical protein R3272_09185 [Candidatus Promineifilaceae bacterium]|nr:hypothetical protein [Candidatus Promineifilaceae bacterium]
MADREQDPRQPDAEEQEPVADAGEVPGTAAEEVRPSLDEARLETPGEKGEAEGLEGEQFAETGYYGDIVAEPLEADSDLGLRDEDAAERDVETEPVDAGESNK